MVKLEYDNRLLCDVAFLNSLRNLNAREKAELVHKMLYIRTSSKQYKKEHIVVLKSSVPYILPELAAKENFGISFFSMDDPEFLESEADQICRTLKFASYLTSQPPYRCVILTDPETKQKYLENDHYKTNRENTLRSVRILAGEEALNLINTYFRDFENLRQSTR